MDFSLALVLNLHLLIRPQKPPTTHAKNVFARFLVIPRHFAKTEYGIVITEKFNIRWSRSHFPSPHCPGELPL